MAACTEISLGIAGFFRYVFQGKGTISTEILVQIAEFVGMCKYFVEKYYIRSRKADTLLNIANF